MATSTDICARKNTKKTDQPAVSSESISDAEAKKFIDQTYRAQGATITEAQKDQMLKLLRAEETGDIEVMIAALKAGAAYYSPDMVEEGTLMWAAIRGYAPIVKFLLDKNVNVNVQNSSGLTPLMAAVIGGYTDIVKMLIDKNAELTVITKNGASILSFAVANNNVEVARILIVAGAWVANPDSMINKNGISKEMLETMRTAIETRDRELYAMKEISSSSKELKSFSKQEITRRNMLLINAVMRKDMKAVIKALKIGASINGTDSYGRTPLIWAVGATDAALVKALLEKGAEVNVISKEGTSALIIAAAMGSVSIIKILLDYHTDVNILHGKDNSTPLLWAAAQGHIEVVKMLIAAGADTMIIDKYATKISPTVHAVIASLKKKK